MASATQTALGTVKLAGDLGGNNNPVAPELPPSGATAGSYSNPNVTVNAKGLVTNIGSSSAIDVFGIPVASTTALGVVKLGEGFAVASDGTMSIPVATTATPGIVRIGTGITVNAQGLISIDSTAYPSVSSGYTYTGAIITSITNQTVSGAVTLDFSASNTFQLSLTGNVTINAPTNLRSGGTYFMVFRQDATGSRTATFNSIFKFESGSPTTLSTAPNSVDMLRVVVADNSTLLAKLYKNFA